MSEEEIVNRFLNMIATKYNGDLANQFKNQYILKDKEIERLNNVINKAIEYIKECNVRSMRLTEDNNLVDDLDIILNILKGVDKE